MTRLRPTRLLALAVALPLGLAACSSTTAADRSTTTTRAAGHQGAASVCSLLSPGRIGSTLGTSVGAPAVANLTNVTTCIYPTLTGRTGDPVIIAFHGHVAAAESDAEQAALTKLHGTLTPMAVTGGTAFSYTEASDGGTVTSLVTLIGTTQVSVTSTAPLARIESLSQSIFTAFSTVTSTTSTAPVVSTTAAS